MADEPHEPPGGSVTFQRRVDHPRKRFGSDRLTIGITW